MKHERVHSKLDELHVCTRFDLSVRTSCTRKPECTRVATFTQLASGNWRVQVRRKTRYVAETFRRRKDGEEWALEMERNIDRNGSSKPRAARNVRTFGDLIDLHDEDMHEVGKPPRPSKTNRTNLRQSYRWDGSSGMPWQRHSSASDSAPYMAPVSAFFLSGRCNVSVMTPPAISVLTCSVTKSSFRRRRGPAL